MVKTSSGTEKTRDETVMLIRYGGATRWSAIMAEVESKNRQLLIDNGAEFSAISETLYRKCVRHKGCPKSRAADVRLADGSLIGVQFGVWIPIILEATVFDILFRVIPMLTVNMLLGNNVLSRCNILSADNVLEVPVEAGHVRCKTYPWNAQKETGEVLSTLKICVFGAH